MSETQAPAETVVLTVNGKEIEAKITKRDSIPVTALSAPPASEHAHV